MQKDYFAKNIAEISIQRSKVALIFAPLIVFLSYHLAIWVESKEALFIDNWSVGAPFFIVALCVLGFLHEILHGLAYSIEQGVSWKNIKIGFNWRQCIPFCSCDTPVRIGTMRLVLLLPVFVTSFGSGLLLCYFPSKLMVSIFVISVGMASTDIWSFIKLLRFDRRFYVTGHPSQFLGFQIYKK